MGSLNEFPGRNGRDIFETLLGAQARLGARHKATTLLCASTGRLLP